MPDHHAMAATERQAIRDQFIAIRDKFAPISAQNIDIINAHIMRELARSIAKHGRWDDMAYGAMLDTILDEWAEVNQAVGIGDLHTEHGAFNEACQVIACCIKLCNQIIERRGREDGNKG